MRLYLKLVTMILVSAGVHRALPMAVEMSRDASFTFRCGIAHWTGDERLQEQVLDEAWAQLVMDGQRRLAAAGRPANADSSGIPEAPGHRPIMGEIVSMKKESASAFPPAAGISIVAADSGADGAVFDERSAAPAAVR